MPRQWAVSRQPKKGFHFYQQIVSSLLTNHHTARLTTKRALYVVNVVCHWCLLFTPFPSKLLVITLHPLSDTVCNSLTRAVLHPV